MALWKRVFTTVRGEKAVREGFIVKAEFDENGYGRTIDMTGRARVDTAGRTRHSMMYWSVEISP